MRNPLIGIQNLLVTNPESTGTNLETTSGNLEFTGRNPKFSWIALHRAILKYNHHIPYPIFVPYLYCVAFAIVVFLAPVQTWILLPRKLNCLNSWHDIVSLNIKMILVDKNAYMNSIISHHDITWVSSCRLNVCFSSSLNIPNSTSCCLYRVSFCINWKITHIFVRI